MSDLLKCPFKPMAKAEFRPANDGFRYRYILIKTWAEGPLLVALMLNPSKADEVRSDHTVTKMTNIARKLGYGGICVLNIFALVSTDPGPVQVHSDPVGPENDAWIRKGIAMGDGKVFVAWSMYDWAKPRVREMAGLLQECGAQPFCLAKTKDGSPRHPSRLAYADLNIEPYEIPLD